MLNKENLARLIEHLRQLPPKQFGMEKWGGNYACGTVACIGGWAYVLDGGSLDEMSSKIHSSAARWLGLNYQESFDLFLPEFTHISLEEITLPMAVKVLENLWETGEVDWSVCDE